MRDMDNRTERIYNRLSVLLMVAVTIILIFVVYRIPIYDKGEADDYALACEAIQMTGNLEITQEVVDKAKLDYPNFSNRIEQSWVDANENAGTSLFVSESGRIYPWYGFAYPLLCIPIKVLLAVLGMNQTYAFVLTNLVFYIGALLYLYFRYEGSEKNRFLLTLCLICSPTIVYYSWSSAEIFIYSMVVISLVNFSNKNYRRSALYLSIAGMMNTTVMFLGIVYIVDYFIEKLKGVQSVKGAFLRVIREFKDIVSYGICFVPCLVTYLYNKIFMGTFELQTSLGLATSEGWLGRFRAYLFDLNMGYIVYYGILFILWFVIFFLALLRKNRKTIELSIAFLGVVLMYSLTKHINCGMEGIARYSAWAAPIFIFTVITQYEEVVVGQKVKNIFAKLYVLSAVITFCIIMWFGAYNKYHCFYYSPLAEMVMERCPQLYNPYPYTFISRTNHVDGGYWGDEYKQINAYVNKEDYVTKVLMTEENVKKIQDNMVADQEAKKYINDKIKKINFERNKFYYINIPPKYKVFFDKGYPERFDPKLNFDLSSAGTGFYWNEGGYHWVSNKAKIIINNEKIAKDGLKISYMVSDLIQKKYGDQENVNVHIYVNNRYVGEIDLSKPTDKGQFIIMPDDLPSTRGDYYFVKFESDCFYQPNIDMPGTSDQRKLCFLLSYIGENIK